MANAYRPQAIWGFSGQGGGTWCALMAIPSFARFDIFTPVMHGWKSTWKELIRSDAFLPFMRWLLVFVLAFFDNTCLQAAATLTSSLSSNKNLVITWNSRGTLEKADQISGPWTTITNA